MAVLESAEASEYAEVADAVLQHVDKADQEAIDTIATAYVDSPCAWSKLAPLVKSVGAVCRPEVQLPQMRERLDRLFARSPSERQRGITRALELLMGARGTSESEVLEYVVDRLVARYKETPDEAILGAFDSVTFDAGNGVQLCRFYREISHVPALVQHYHRPGSVRTNLKRCRVGSGISREDYARLVP